MPLNWFPEEDPVYMVGWDRDVLRRLENARDCQGHSPEMQLFELDRTLRGRELAGNVPRAKRCDEMRSSAVFFLSYYFEFGSWFVKRSDSSAFAQWIRECFVWGWIVPSHRVSVGGEEKLQREYNDGKTCQKQGREILTLDWKYPIHTGTDDIYQGSMQISEAITQNSLVKYVCKVRIDYLSDTNENLRYSGWPAANPPKSDLLQF
ncbi:hypothetical protein R3P38DRAFT_2810316 [Favolaschia claudopus]|uniref:Uncharacterized protein n=1 Tax=Favolaschia claudopus TaxID=2862362 RepID=A0AAV9ZAM3_9AGAR